MCDIDIAMEWAALSTDDKSYLRVDTSLKTRLPLFVRFRTVPSY